MTKVANELLTAVDSRQPTVLLSRDISTGFDMLDHDRLLNRATELFGISGQVTDWLESYLTGRISYIRFCWQMPFIYCVLQNRVQFLDRFPFSAFITPVSRLISACNLLCHQCADDTRLYTSMDLSSDNDIDNLSNCADAVTRGELKAKLDRKI